MQASSKHTSQDVRSQANQQHLQRAASHIRNKNFAQALKELECCQLTIMNKTTRNMYNHQKLEACHLRNAFLMQEAQSKAISMPFEALSLLDYCMLDIMSEPVRAQHETQKTNLNLAVNYENRYLINQAEHEAHQSRYKKALERVQRCDTHIMDTKTHDDFCLLKARCFLHEHEPHQALSALNQLRTPPSKDILIMFAQGYRQSGDYERMLSVLTSFDNWQQDVQVTRELQLLTLSFTQQKQYISAINILKLDSNWASNESKVFQVAQLYTDKAKCMPECSEERATFITAAINTYMLLPCFNTRREVLLALAPLHFLMRDYNNALSAYYAVGMGPGEQQNQIIRSQIQMLEAYFAASKPVHTMQEAHSHLTMFANQLLSEGYIIQAHDFYCAIPENFKSFSARRNQASCAERLGFQQTSVLASSTFRPAPPEQPRVQPSAQHQETCYNPEQSHHSTTYS